MNCRLVFRSAARAEFDEATAWYEARREGLGAEFVLDIQRVLDRICDNPTRYPIVVGDVREAPAAKFPYCIYYRPRRDRLVILAVFHTSRDPAVWLSRT